MQRLRTRNRSILISVTILMIILSGCMNAHTDQPSGTAIIGNPTPADFLDHGDADIFMLDEVVFKNAEHLDWVNELAYTLGDEIGQITKQSDTAADFEHGTASKLPIGTKICATDTQVYIAIVDGRQIRYIKMLEG